MANTPIFSPKIPTSKEATVLWTGLAGCSDSLVLANAINNEDRLFVIVTPDNRFALGALAHFLLKRRACHFTFS